MNAQANADAQRAGLAMQCAIAQCAEARKGWPDTSFMWPHVGLLTRFERGGRRPMVVIHPGPNPSLDIRRVRAYRGAGR